MDDKKKVFSPSSQSAATSNQMSTAQMEYKAKKYHHKIQDFLNREYVMKGLPIPAGYESYLQPFRSQSGGSQMVGQNGDQDDMTKLMRHKAIKYHYKIQNLLNTEYVMKGIAIPAGYESYMKPFQG